MSKRCEFQTDDGACSKHRTWEGNTPCERSSISWFDDCAPANAVDADRMCEVNSVFGNEYITITEKQLGEMRGGKVLYLYINDEYGVFIRLDQKEVRKNDEHETAPAED